MYLLNKTFPVSRAEPWGWMINRDRRRSTVHPAPWSSLTPPCPQCPQCPLNWPPPLCTPSHHSCLHWLRITPHYVLDAVYCHAFPGVLMYYGALGRCSYPLPCPLLPRAARHTSPPQRVWVPAPDLARVHFMQVSANAFKLRHCLSLTILLDGWSGGSRCHFQYLVCI